MSHQPTHRQLQRSRAQMVICLAALGMLLFGVVFYLVSIQAGQVDQNLFSIFSRRENRQTLASLGVQVATLKADLRKANLGKSSAEGTARVLATQMEQQQRFFSGELTTGLRLATRQMRADLGGQVASLAGQVTALKTEVANARQANRIQVDARNQLQAIYRDSLAVVPGTGSRPQSIRVINYGEPQGWFDLHGSVSDTSLNFNPNFHSRYQIHFTQEGKVGGFLGLFGSRLYRVSVRDLNPYNRTDSVSVLFDSGFDQEAIIPVAGPRK